MMNIIIITQEDPFYLARSISYLLKNLPNDIKVVATVVFSVSPFGKKESFINKIKKTYNIFGLGFLLHYSWRFLINKLNRNTNIKYILKNNNIPIIKLKKSINHEESMQILRRYCPEVLVSIAGNQIFKKPLIDLAPKGCINLHTALLPKYRGLMPSFWVLKNNEEYTGVSIFFVDEGIDSGPIIVKKKMKIGSMSQAELIKHSKKIGMDAIVEALKRIRDNHVHLISNDDENMTYYSFPTRSDVKEFKKIGKKFF